MLLFQVFWLECHNKLCDSPGGATHFSIFFMFQKQKLIRYFSVALSVSALIACNPAKRLNQDFNYFQKGIDSLANFTLKEPTIRVNDFLTIQVFSGTSKQDDALLFNLPGSSGNTAISNNPSQASNNSGYQVDIDGNIELPKIGKIRALGLTKYDLASIISSKLKSEEYLKDPSVVVKFQMFKVNVLGEVRRPGVIICKSDKVTILDAIAEAGDLSETGRRDDILLMRQVGEKWQSYRIDLRNTKFMQSPAFQLQQNDMIYVASNDIKLKTLNVNPNFQKDFGFVTAALNSLFFLVNVIVILRR